MTGQRKPRTNDHRRRGSRCSPVGLLMALSAMSASVPVMGNRFRRFGDAAAMTIWACGHVPGVMSRSLRARTHPERPVSSGPTPAHKQIARDGLAEIVPAGRFDAEWPAARRIPPLWSARRQRRKYLYAEAVNYGDDPSQALDVWRKAELSDGPAPVLIFVPGGGWISGSRRFQGYAMMAQLAELGWVCLSIDYRVSPRYRWPTQIVDVKAAVAWAKENADSFGGTPEFVAVAGCSAGGHLAALTALTEHDPAYAADLPYMSDSSVDAAVCLYGCYDWEDRSTRDRSLFQGFLERFVVGQRFDQHPEVFRAASPIARIHSGAPPLLVLHGSADKAIPVVGARAFVERLRAISRAPVGYVELPGAQHGFDMTDGASTAPAVAAISLFLSEIRLRQQAKTSRHIV
jgi:acetyl esterase/lipase